MNLYESVRTKLQESKVAEQQYMCNNCRLVFGEDDLTSIDDDGNDLCPACGSSNIADITGISESSLKESSLLDPAFTVCYNRLDIFPTRKAAMDFFKTCMYSSEGSERERYTNVYLELMDGSDTGFDGDGDSVNEVAWVNEDGNVVEKEKLGSWEDANKIIKQIKGGKKMPPKGFLDLFK